mmetsp:Transcript_95860/g.266201  ORF Transcript_95860/g.266201 Transcript_95860/m.266201 type:complete len:364 (-) Transcript_95860:11-1102(-)
MPQRGAFTLHANDFLATPPGGGAGLGEDSSSGFAPCLAKAWRRAQTIFSVMRASASKALWLRIAKPARSASLMASVSWSKSLLAMAVLKRSTTAVLFKAFGEAPSSVMALASISSTRDKASSISRKSKNTSSAKMTALRKASSSFDSTAFFSASRARCRAAARRPSSRASLSSAGRRPAARPAAMARSTSARSGGSFINAPINPLSTAFSCGVWCRLADGGRRGVTFGAGRKNLSVGGGPRLSSDPESNTGCGSDSYEGAERPNSPTLKGRCWRSVAAGCCSAFCCRSVATCLLSPRSCAGFQVIMAPESPCIPGWYLITAPRSPSLSSPHTQLDVAPMARTRDCGADSARWDARYGCRELEP